MTSFALVAVVLVAQTEVDGVVSGRRIPHCGVAAVYGTAILLGVEADPDEIEISLLKTNPGVDLAALSLTQLSEAFGHLGLRATPKQCEPSDAIYLKTPFVAYFSPRRIARSGDYAGHVVIVTSISHDGVRILDLTESSQPINVAFTDFRDGWDGHYIEVEHDDEVWTTVANKRIGWIAIATVSFVAFGYSLRRYRADAIGPSLKAVDCDMK